MNHLRKKKKKKKKHDPEPDRDTRGRHAAVKQDTGLQRSLLK